MSEPPPTKLILKGVRVIIMNERIYDQVSKFTFFFYQLIFICFSFFKSGAVSAADLPRQV